MHTQHDIIISQPSSQKFAAVGEAPSPVFPQKRLAIYGISSGAAATDLRGCIISVMDMYVVQ